jgi:nucleoside 2-deoxyribosyltransferase
VGRRNAELIEESDALFAILDGADVDSGTAAEVGYAAARGKPIVGVREDLRQTGDNPGVTVNLQVEYFIRSTGGSIETSLERGLEQLARLLGR